MACDNCKGLEGFWCPACQPQGIDTRDIHARAPIDRVKALEAEVDRLRAENARLTSELDAANARIASAAARVRNLKRKHADWCPGSEVSCQCGEFRHDRAIEDAAQEVERV